MSLKGQTKAVDCYRCGRQEADGISPPGGSVTLTLPRCSGSGAKSSAQLPAAACLAGPARRGGAAAPLPDAPIPTALRAGRNGPCPCGSGKKFKKCCGANSPLG